MVVKLNQDSTVQQNTTFHMKRDIKGRLLTAALWGMGIALPFMAPLLRDRVPLSVDLAMISLNELIILFPAAIHLTRIR